MLLAAILVFCAAFAGLCILGLSGARRRFLHFRIDRRRIERRNWREPPERRYRR